MNSPRRFINNLVGYVDILGFVDKIHKNENDQIIELLEIISNTAKKKDDFIIKWLKDGKEQSLNKNFFNFSDSIILTFEFNDHIKHGHRELAASLISLTGLIVNLHLEALKLDCLLRGAISCGSLYIDPQRNIYCGDCLNESIKNEKDTKYPRVVVSQTLLNKLKDFWMVDNVLEEVDTLRDCQLAVDCDGQTCYVNYPLIIKDHNNVESYKLIIKKNIMRYENDNDVLSKWKWLEERVNE